MATIRLTNGRTFEADPERSILDCADAAGVRMPRGCKVGSCRTCTALLREGKVAQVTGTALTTQQRQQGLILPCVAYARGDAVIEPGPGLLPVLPWTE